MDRPRCFSAVDFLFLELSTGDHNCLVRRRPAAKANIVKNEIICWENKKRGLIANSLLSFSLFFRLWHLSLLLMHMLGQGHPFASNFHCKVKRQRYEDIKETLPSNKLLIRRL